MFCLDSIDIWEVASPVPIRTAVTPAEVHRRALFYIITTVMSASGRPGTASGAWVILASIGMKLHFAPPPTRTRMVLSPPSPLADAVGGCSGNGCEPVRSEKSVHCHLKRRGNHLGHGIEDG